MLHTLTAQFGAILTTLVCGLALILGGQRERIGGAVFGLCGLIGIAGQYLFPAWLDVIVLGLDFLCLLVFINLCWKSPHPWPLWAAALQLMAVTSEVSRLQNLQVSQWTYLTISIVSGYGVLLVLFVGTLATVKSRRAK